MSLRRKAEEGAHAGARKASTIDRVRKRRCACVATCRVEAASRIPDPIDPTDPSPRSRPRPSRGCRCPVPLPRLGRRGRGRSLRALSTRCATPAAPGRTRSIPAKAPASPRRRPAVSAVLERFEDTLGTKAPWSWPCSRARWLRTLPVPWAVQPRGTAHGTGRVRSQHCRSRFGHRGTEIGSRSRQNRGVAKIEESPIRSLSARV